MLFDKTRIAKYPEVWISTHNIKYIHNKYGNKNNTTYFRHSSMETSIIRMVTKTIQLTSDIAVWKSHSNYTRAHLLQMLVNTGIISINSCT